MPPSEKDGKIDSSRRWEPHGNFYFWKLSSKTLLSIRCFGQLPATVELPILIASRNKLPEQRMRLQRLRFELGMELAPNEIRMVRNLDDLYIS